MYSKVLLLLLLGTLSLTLGASAKASSAVPCMVDDSGQCASWEATANYATYQDSVSYLGFNGTTHCYSTNYGDYYTHGINAYTRVLKVAARWCSNGGKSYLVSFSPTIYLPHGLLCSPNNLLTSTYSGGLYSSWITKHYEVNYHCQTIWPFGFNDRIHFNVRYGTYGAHYFVPDYS